MAEASKHKQTLQEAIAALTEGGRNQSDLKSCVIVVEEAARTDGLLPNHILSLSNFIASRNANSTILSRTVRSLIPRTSVPCSAVLRLMGSLKGQTLSLQLLIIRWIILVYDIIDNKADLHAIYGALFYYLQVDELRPVICQLLCYLTRRCDVTHFRVQQLTELAKHVDSSRGAEAGLSALFTLYHSYCPHMVGRTQLSRKRAWFRPFEKQLASNIRRLQKNSPSTDSGASQEERATSEDLHTRLTAAPPPPKRSKVRVTTVPNPLPSLRREGRNDKVSTGELNTHRQLCDNITHVEFPSQVASVLNSHSVQHLFSVGSEPSTSIRFTYWLEHSFGYELDQYTPGTVNHDLQCLLQSLYKLTKFIQEPIPTVESFLHILLEEWNGDDYRHEILNLLTHISLQPFDSLEEGFLRPLKQIFVSKEREFKFASLVSLSRLLKNIALFEWPRHHKRTVPSSDGQPLHRVSLFSTVTEEDAEDFNPLITIRLFIKYVDHLILIALEQEEQHMLVFHAAMMFYEVVADLPRVYGIPHLSLPTPSILLSGLLGPTPVHVSRACSHLVKVKQSLSDLSRNERDLQLTQMFNSMVLDFCDALWRNMIFKKKSKTSYPTLAFDLPRDLLESCSILQPHKRLNLVHHPALIGLVIQFFMETQEADRLHQLAPSAIWQESQFKQVYLQFLSQNYLTGITDFIKTFVHTN